jgi:hypothetical protein
VELKKYADDLAQDLEALKEQAVNEFQNRWGGKEVHVAGAVVTKHEGGRYVYDHIEGYKEVKNNLTLFEKAAHIACKAGGPVLDEETGVLTQPAKYVPNKPSLSVKFPKG